MTGGPSDGAVLIAFDGSDHARHAIRRLSDLLPGGPAVVVHVWQSFVDSLLGSDVELPSALEVPARQANEMDRAEAERTLAEGVELARTAGLDARGRLIEGEGSVWPTIIDEADQEKARVVVLGSRGLSRVKSALLGSVSNGVLHHCSRPVLVVPAAEPFDEESVSGAGDRRAQAER